MGKRRAKTPRRQHAPAKLTRKQSSRLERERRLERYLIIGAIVVAVAVVGVLAYGLINEYVIKAASSVATVGTTQIRTDEFQSRVRFLRANMALQLQQWEEQRRSIDPSTETSDLVLSYIDQSIRQLEATLAEENKAFIGAQAIDQLVRYELVRQEAARRGIDISPDEVQREIELEFNYDRDAAPPPVAPTEVISPELEPQPVPTPVSEESFREQYDYFTKDILKPLGITDKQYRLWAEADVLDSMLRQEMAADLPSEAEQIQFRLLVVGDADHAQELSARLDGGEAFQTLVDQIEADEDTTDYVREFEWLPIEQVEEALGPDVAAELWGLEPSGLASPLVSEDGLQFYIPDVLGHEVRAIEEGLIDTLADALFEEWVTAQMDSIVEISSYEERTPSNP